MKIGDKLTVAVKVNSVYSRNGTKTVGEVEIEPIECLYLGDTSLHEGKVVVIDSYYNLKGLQVKRAIPVSVVQPVSSGRQYRKPFHTKRIA